MLSRSLHHLGRLLVHLTLFMVIIVAAEELSLPSNFDNDGKISTDKRYLAAMAKNGRLPKLSNYNKREGSSEEKAEVGASNEAWVDEKRHYGAFLKSHGKPNFENGVQARRYAPTQNKYSGSEESDIETAGKRNVASLARLGRLNAVRFGRLQPQYFGGGKRVNVYNEEMNDGQASENNEVIPLSDECEDEAEERVGKSSNTEDNYVYQNWFEPQQKRYVAALARSGRLPSWHPQRMWWGGKRDIPNAYWLRYRSGARAIDNRLKSSPSGVRFLKHKNKRCKKSGSPAENASNAAEEKRNLSMLARKGMIPFRSGNSA